jgi:hypothetical protein
MTAFRATYSDWKLIKTRGVVQVVMEIPLADADAAYDVLGGMPVHGKERWFGIAALKSPAEEARAKLRQDVPQDSHPDGAKRKMDWREVQPAAQAGIRCEDAQFRAFLREEMGYSRADSPRSAAGVVREICHVNSRSEFSTDNRKRVLWHSLDSQFQAWQAKERVGA